MLSHTPDSIGSEALNQRLSDERANAVMEYLVSKGINASRLTAQGFGETRPIVFNDTREEEPKTVELKLY